MSPRLSDRLLRTQTDERLAALAADGHEQAFAVLVYRHRGPLLAFARGLGTGARAEDVVQQALMQCWLALRRGTEVEHVRGWLYQATRHAAWRATAAPVADELSPALAAAADTESEVERALETRSVLAGLQRLPERQRDALVQTALEGRAGPEVADELGLTDNAFRQLVFRARTALRTATSVLVPLPLVTWAAARSSTGSPMNERLAGMLGAGGATGSAAALTKLAALAAVAGTVAGGVVVHHALDGAPHAGTPTRSPAQASAGDRPRPVRHLRASPPPSDRRPVAAPHAEPRARSLGGEATAGAVPAPSPVAGTAGTTPDPQRSVAVGVQSTGSRQHAGGSAPAPERPPAPTQQPAPEPDGEPTDPTPAEGSSSPQDTVSESEDAPSLQEPGENEDG